jgi:hypothetical protein
MQAAGHLHNLGIVFRRVLTHPIQEIAVNMLIKTQYKFAKFMATGLNSERGKAESGDSQRESPKPSATAMYFEMGIALAAVFGLLVVGALVWYWANRDWLSSIPRLQEMI